jgi:hypothetical protein
MDIIDVKSFLIRTLMLSGATIITLTVSEMHVLASCECLCIDGRTQPVCDNPSDQARICPARECPSTKAISPPQIPPSGIATCAPEQVQDPDTHQLEWRIIYQ